MRQLMAVLLIVLLSAGSQVAFAAQDTPRLTLQEQVAQIPGGALVKAKLKNKQTVQGRLGEVTATGYTVQVTTGSQVQNRQVTFDETKSVKQTNKSHTGLAVGLGIVGGVALAFGIIAALYVATGS